MISRKAALTRKRAVAFAAFLYARRGHLEYAEVRPMRSFETEFCTMPKAATDCSESTAMILHAAGAPTPYVTPSGDGFAGYTGTMLASLPHIGLRSARRGDLVVLGITSDTPGGKHVVMLIQRPLYHPDPLVWSHGGPGVDQMPLSAMLAGWPGEGHAVLRSVPARLA